MRVVRSVAACAALCAACGGTPAPHASVPEERPAVPLPTPASSKPSAPSKPKPAAAVAVEPEVAWSEDGKWIAWRTSLDDFVVARTTDFAPVRTMAKAARVDFAGNWLVVGDGTQTRFENPADGARMSSSSAPFESSIVTRSAIAILDPSSPRMISRTDGKERALPIAKSCAATDDLDSVTAAASMSDLIAVDVQCRTRGAPPCTGARGNCESGASFALIVDAARGTTTRLAESFWAGPDVVMFSPDAQKLVVAGQSSTTASVLDAKTGRQLRRFDVFPPKSAGQGIGCGTWAPDSETFYLVTHAGVAGFSPRSGQRVARAGHGLFDDFGLSCTAKIVDGALVTTPVATALLRLRLPKLDVPQELLLPRDVILPIFSESGRFAVLTGPKGTSILDARTFANKPVDALDATERAVFDPTSTFVALHRTVWDLRTLTRVATLHAAP